jgi:outer membrane protein assembly factor BamA
MLKKLLYLSVILITHNLVYAQDTIPPDLNIADQKFVIRNIRIEGNKKTKGYIIEREIPFKTGDAFTLDELVKKFDTARMQLTNTLLFHNSFLAMDSLKNDSIDVLVSVKERWYIFPIPYLQPVDRNFAEWRNQGLGLDRLKYGLKFTYNNFSGRNDKLKVWLITGYTKQFQIQYEQPYSDPTLKHGFKVGFAYAHNAEVNYMTDGNKLQFVDTTPFGKKKWYAHIDYLYRPGLRTYHSLRLSINGEHIDDEIFALNPNYLNGEKKVIYPELKYNFKFYGVDYIYYPLKGWLVEGNFIKRGISSPVNMWQIDGRATYTQPLKNKFYLQWQGYFLGRLPNEQPYYNVGMMGFGDFYLRGLENYVVDGLAGALSRQTAIRQIVEFSIPNLLKKKTIERVPFRIFARVYGDLGYGYNKININNLLNNKLLYTTGVGLDITTFYDFVFRLDYNINQLGQKGLFLHVRNDF